MKSVVLVTGSSGFVGRNLLRVARHHYLDADWVCADALSPEPPADCPRGTVVHRVRLDDWSATQHLIADVQPTHVIHLAGALGKARTAENIEQLYRSNLVSTCHLLESLRSIRPSDAGAPRVHFMLISTGLVYGAQTCPYREWMPALPPDTYSLTKFLAEKAVRTFERLGVVDACILRPAILYGPDQKGDMFVPSLVAAVRESRRFAMTAGEQTRDFVHIDDMVTAVLLASQSRFIGTYNVGTGKPVSMRQVGELAAALVGRPDLLGLGEVPYRDREVWDYSLDPARLKGAGWCPQSELHEGLRECVQPSTLESQFTGCESVSQRDCG